MTKIIDKVGWILIQNQKLLGVRSYGKDLFYIPGGKREAGESDIETLTREVMEELSVQITDGIQFLGEFSAPADGKKEGVIVTVQSYQAHYLGQLMPSAEIEEIRWLGTNDYEACSNVTIEVIKALVEKGWVV
ncbi:MAG: NUDIX domain-containing protein [Merismopedia sp. SIO2A8]|nr:NUDIX domain-containing protein [Merismopedia sp. SIO2A8]